MKKKLTQRLKEQIVNNKKKFIASILLFVIGIIYQEEGVIMIALFLLLYSLVNGQSKEREIKRKAKLKEKYPDRWFSWGWFLFWFIFGGGIGGIIYLLVKIGDKK